MSDRGAESPRNVAIGIDVGGTKVLAGAIDEQGELLASARVASPATPEALLPTLKTALDELLGALGPRPLVEGVGLALPGLVDEKGVLHAAPNLGAAERGLDLAGAFGRPLLGHLEVAHRRAARCGLALENDATAAAYAEVRCGAARGHSDVVVVSLGTGIGAGIVADGKVVRGAHHFAGELGHMIVVPDGVPCPCGRSGCWERYASGSALERFAEEALATGASSSLGAIVSSGGELHGEAVAAAARAGDALARSVWSTFSAWLALGLSNAVELLDPELLVLGGGLVREADLFLEETRAAFVASCRRAQGRHEHDVVLATLGEHAACTGAALLGLEARPAL